MVSVHLSEPLWNEPTSSVDNSLQVPVLESWGVGPIDIRSAFCFSSRLCTCSHLHMPPLDMSGHITHRPVDCSKVLMLFLYLQKRRGLRLRSSDTNFFLESWVGGHRAFIITWFDQRALPKDDAFSSGDTVSVVSFWPSISYSRKYECRTCDIEESHFPLVKWRQSVYIS